MQVDARFKRIGPGIHHENGPYQGPTMARSVVS
jgi:hypothetical protein